MTDPEFIARMSESAPVRMVMDLRATAKDCITRAERNIELAESIMAAKTGHAPKPGQIPGLTCICGWYMQGGYPGDKQRAVWAHVENEWRSAI